MKLKKKMAYRWEAAIIAVTLLVTAIILPISPINSFASVSSDEVNLLDGRPFSTVGKPARKAMYHWTHENGVEPKRSAFCIQPENHMWNSAVPQITYGINDNPPLIQSAEQFQELALTLQWCGNIEGAGKSSNDKYIVAQAAIWVIMANERVGSAFLDRSWLK